MADELTIPAANHPNWFWRLTFYLGPDLLILGIFTATLAVFVAIYGGKFTFAQSSVCFPLIIMGVFILFGLFARLPKILSGDAQRRKEALRFTLELVRDWSPIAMIMLVYENFHDLTDLIRPEVVDATLRRIDEAIFGVEPTVAFQKITCPGLSEYMTFAYALYFVYPVLFLAILYFRKDLIKFRELYLAVCLCVYLGLLGYILVPAIGPRYFMNSEFTVPIQGIWLTERAAAAWNAVESVKRDCFPSLHTAISSVALIYLWRYRKVWRGGKVLLAICAPLIASLWMSTIYLRYHWTIDVFAGWALAIFCSWVAPVFIRWYYRRKLGSAPEVSIDVRRTRLAR